MSRLAATTDRTNPSSPQSVPIKASGKDTIWKGTGKAIASPAAVRQARQVKTNTRDILSEIERRGG